MTGTDGALIRVSDVTKRYAGGGPPALDRVSLAVAPGEAVAVMGPSGSGKSTPDHRFASGVNDTGPIFPAVIILIGTLMSLLVLEAALGVVSTVVLTTMERVRDRPAS